MKNKKKGIGCFGFIVLALIIGSCGMLFGSDDKDDTSKTTEAVQPTIEITTETEEITTETTTEATTKTTTEEMSVGQKNALGSAKNYLSFQAFSKDGLKGQLEY